MVKRKVTVEENKNFDRSLLQSETTRFYQNTDFDHVVLCNKFEIELDTSYCFCCVASVLHTFY